MESKMYKYSGISLVLGAALLILTMVLHPMGGSIEYIIKISRVIIISHSIALFGIPFITFGFYGVYRRLCDDTGLSVLAFIFNCLAMMTGVLAGTINGLATPFFVNKYHDRIPDLKDQLGTVMQYGFALNKAFDLILIISFCISMMIWSVLIIWKQKLPSWLGWFGILISLLALCSGILGYNFISVTGFSFFIFGISIWILGLGYCQIRKPL